MSVFGPTFDLCQCSECGVQYGVPEGYRARRQNDGKTFYCPNGHAQCFRISETDKLRQERDRLKQQIAQKDDEIAEAKRQAASAKGQVTRLIKRAKAGVCPCCNRTFTNLARHMASKHKDEGAALQ